MNAFVSVIVDGAHYMGNKLCVEMNRIKITGIYPLEMPLRNVVRITQLKSFFPGKDLILEYLDGWKPCEIRLRFLTARKRQEFCDIINKK